MRVLRSLFIFSFSSNEMIITDDGIWALFIWRSILAPYLDKFFGTEIFSGLGHHSGTSWNTYVSTEVHNSHSGQVIISDSQVVNTVHMLPMTMSLFLTLHSRGINSWWISWSSIWGWGGVLFGTPYVGSIPCTCEFCTCFGIFWLLPQPWLFMRAPQSS